MSEGILNLDPYWFQLQFTKWNVFVILCSDLGQHLLMKSCDFCLQKNLRLSCNFWSHKSLAYMKIASFLSVIFATIMAVFVETATSLWFLLVKYNIQCPRSLLPHFGIFVHIDIQTTQQPVSLLLAPHTRQGIRMVHLYCRSCHHSIKIQLNPTQHMPTSYHSWSLWRSYPITYLSWWYLLTSFFYSQASMHDNMISVCDTITLQLYDICVTRCFIDHELFWLHNDQTVVLIGVWVHNYGGISFDHCFGRNEKIIHLVVLLWWLVVEMLLSCSERQSVREFINKVLQYTGMG